MDAQPPRPDRIRASWYPVTVHLPDRPDGTRPRPLRRAKVYATAEGLYVYTAPPVDSLVNPASVGTPDFYSPIQYDKTPLPPTGYAARQNKAVRIHTADGQVMLQRVGACSCGAKLRNWTPTWAHRIEAWETTT